MSRGSAGGWLSAAVTTRRACVAGHHGEDLPGQDDTRVRCADRRRASRHRRHPGGVGEHRDQGGLDPGRVEVGVVNEQRLARRDGGLGIQPLLAAAQRQRDVRRRAGPQRPVRRTS